MIVPFRIREPRNWTLPYRPGLPWIPSRYWPFCRRIRGSVPFASHAFIFSKFDAVPGPTDPKRVCDELFVELYDPAADYSWTQSYLVATPEGLADLLEEKSWKYLRTSSVIIVRRYDVEDIREAVVDYLIEDPKLASPDVPREQAEWFSL